MQTVEVYCYVYLETDQIEANYKGRKPFVATKSAHAIHKNLFEADSNRSGMIMAQNCSVWLCNYRFRPETQINLRAHVLPIALGP